LNVVAITLADIAERTGVTKMTVSLVLNDKKSGLRISEKTRQKIQAVADELNYIPSFSARTLAKGKTFSIGFQCGNIQNAYYSEMAEEAMKLVEKRGYHLLIAVTQWLAESNDLECLETLLGRGVEGVIFFGLALKPGSRICDYVVKERFPLVSINGWVEGVTCVGSEWRSGMEAAVHFLKKKGHTRVGFFRGRAHPLERDEKLIALKQVCGQEKIDLAVYEFNDADLRNVSSFLNDPSRATALIIQSDFTAQATVKGLRKAGLEIPKDVAVVGIDGTKIGEWMHPELTTIAQDKDRMMKIATERIMAMIENKETPCEHIRVPTRLIIRESV
jgi:DNA-binding LacI/PurR family transcriptional regulator